MSLTHFFQILNFYTPWKHEMWENIQKPAIYASGFTNVCFLIKIEFLNVIKSKWVSQGAVHFTTSS